jgi:pimeloyl-ACP methyl ester carboxylesterase
MERGAAPFQVGTGPTIRGESAGEGRPIVVCHGITATRRYVLHGSRTLERGGHRVIAYDARGHGESDPAPPGGGYAYPELVEDLEAVVEAEAGEGRFALAGHSMGAHTAVAYALANPGRVEALIVIGPVYTGDIRPESIGFWDGLAAALEEGGIDGFVDHIDRVQGIDPGRREAVLRFTRERMSLHRDLGAVATALRETPRSRPFGSLAELEAIELPCLVVASRDEADPGHPYEVAAEYARLLPDAELIGEEEGESPLAWQGGRLSREIEAFCARVVDPQE